MFTDYNMFKNYQILTFNYRLAKIYPIDILSLMQYPIASLKCAYFAVTSFFLINFCKPSRFSCLSVSDCNPEGIFANCLLFYRIFGSMLKAIQALSFNVFCFTNNLRMYVCTCVRVYWCLLAWVSSFSLKHVHRRRVNILQYFKKEFLAYFTSKKSLERKLYVMKEKLDLYR